jgi:plastocyanin
MRSMMGWGALLAVALAACGGGSSNGGESTTPAGTPGGTPAANPPSSSNVITIQGMAFSPLRLEVTPGATVTVRNLDAEVHSVTSQSTRGAFRPGAANGVSFDTGLFTGERTFTIPSNAQVGTTVPYFCSSHLQTMVTPNGEIAIVASPTGSGGTPSAPSTPSTPSQPTSPYANE